jgi:hypothetical protein
MSKTGLSIAVLILVASLRVAVAQMYTVTNTNGSGPGSLYDAIGQASGYPGGSTITFNIPGPGVHVIDVGANPLPHVQKLFIDGYSQPGAHPNTLTVGDDAVILIQIDGGGVKGRYGFWITGFTHIRGLAITGCETGVAFLDPFGGNMIEGSFIGLDPSGHTSSPNQTGVFSSRGGTIGGNTPAMRNVISGNGTGVALGPGEATVAGNYIGTDLNGTQALPNSIGVSVEKVNVQPPLLIGGNDGNSANVISGNNYGIILGFRGLAPDGHRFSNPANYVTISGNFIGTAADGKGRLGNAHQGVAIWDGTNNTIGGTPSGSGNTIAFNGGPGVSIENWAGSASGNQILSNSIYANGICNIDLNGDGPTPNDPLDTDEGPNRLQNFPIITGTFFSGNAMAINGVLHSAPNTQFTIQIFSDGDDYVQPSQNLLGTVNAVTDNNGKGEFYLGVNLDDVHGPIDATATDPAGNTSEFFLRPSHLRNLSTRARVQTGDAVMIGGFIPEVLPNVPSEIVVRALGPSLSSGGTPFPGRLDDPVLEVYQNGQLIASNDNWQEDASVVTEVQKYGLAPGNASEAAAVIYPVAGAQYTAVVRGKNNSSGIALVEFYDVSGTNSRPVNLSTRGLVQGGDNVMIGGTILQDGTGPTRVVIRAIGPSLANLGIANPLPDPVLELRDANGGFIAINDDWKDDHEAEITLAGLAPTNPAESAIFISLEPGSYTAIVRGKENSTGLALVELYQLP